MKTQTRIERWLTDKLCEWFAGIFAPSPWQSGCRVGQSPIGTLSRPKLEDILGQEDAVAALIVAAAGSHNVLMVGPPGEGKSYLASALPSILPPLWAAERAELATVYQAAGRYHEADRYGPAEAPYVEVSPAITLASLIGGGRSNPVPGALSLAHCGVLFLDELPEYPRPIIEALRSPLESGQTSIVRHGQEYIFPARVLLVAASNPCPCGYGSTSPLCACSPATIDRYLARISGPILDRIDLIVPISSLPLQEDSDGSPVILSPPLSSAIVRERVTACRAFAAKRCRQSQSRPIPNSRLGGSDILRNTALAQFNADAHRYLLRLKDQSLGLSTRRIVRIGRVARTLADYSQSPQVSLTQTHHAYSIVSPTLADIVDLL